MKIYCNPVFKYLIIGLTVFFFMTKGFYNDDEQKAIIISSFVVLTLILLDASTIPAISVPVYLTQGTSLNMNKEKEETFSNDSYYSDDDSNPIQKTDGTHPRNKNDPRRFGTKLRYPRKQDRTISFEDGDLSDYDTVAIKSHDQFYDPTETDYPDYNQNSLLPMHDDQMTAYPGNYSTTGEVPQNTRQKLPPRNSSGMRDESRGSFKPYDSPGSRGDSSFQYLQ